MQTTRINQIQQGRAVPAPTQQMDAPPGTQMRSGVQNDLQSFVNTVGLDSLSAASPILQSLMATQQVHSNTQSGFLPPSSVPQGSGEPGTLLSNYS